MPASLAIAWLAVLSAAPSAAQTSDDINKSNNPLTPVITVNLQDIYVGSYHELSDSDSNQGLLRAVLPHRLLGLPQILRATVPLVTTPDEPLGSTTGLGDINLFDVFLFKAGPVELGFGPQLTIDSARDDELGTGKWQAGAAGIVLAPAEWGIVGGLVTYQHSFAGDGDRRDQSNLQAQPFFFYNLPHAYYVRSAATWNFDLHTGDYYVPLGLGLGKVWKTQAGATFNLFLEPEWTVAHEGVAPRFQLFMGLNMQFPIRAGT